jgi:hypothetical protein
MAARTLALTRATLVAEADAEEDAVAVVETLDSLDKGSLGMGGMVDHEPRANGSPRHADMQQPIASGTAVKAGATDAQAAAAASTLESELELVLVVDAE